ncbi:MAG: RNA pseudouridine synthase, partial [Lachnospiraceae bacterium]|nr:RNA pseudouridine synthase [Lachnospiraceae bacterium]
MENNTERVRYVVEENECDERLDKFLSEKMSDMSRSYIQKNIKDGKVSVNGKTVKSGYKLNVGDEVILIIEPLEELTIEPENIPLDIIYEDSDIIVLNKQKDMVVHPCPGHYTGTLVNGLLYHCKDQLSGINGELRP